MGNVNYCQSCGMPMEKEEQFGTNADGSKNEDYCVYCYKNGAFTSNVDMDGMIDFCVPIMVAEDSKMTEESARKMLKDFFPTLKRWKKA